jgi:hypothetical protein
MFVIHRANGRCELCGSDVDLQVDHCFTRKCKEIYYDIDNLSCLCQRCHFEKTYHLRARDLDVYGLVAKREGDETFQRLRQVSRAHAPFPQFTKRWYLEEQIEKFRRLGRLCAITNELNSKQYMSTKAV